MYLHHRRLVMSGIALLGISLSCFTSAFAAKPINLNHQSISILHSFAASSQSAIKQDKAHVDFNRTKHMRIHETYKGYQVWGSEAVVHVPSGDKATLASVMAGQNSRATMNGILYQDLNADLQNAPAIIFTAVQADKALKQGIQLFEKKAGVTADIKDSNAKLIVFVDSKNTAHWTYLVNFYVKPGKTKVAKPNYIMDAVTFEVYKQWDNIQTIDDISGGGFGGNVKIGQFTYDGLQDHLPKLNITRDASANICYLQNASVVVKDVRSDFSVFKFNCETPNEEHNKVYWNDTDAVNDGYSPSNDAMFTGEVIKDMYQNWYGVAPIVEEDGKPMMMSMCVHNRDPWMIDNAYWDGKQMVFGDGEEIFYPLVSIGVAAHEVSHGFTEQHSGLDYNSQSGGMNEAFSDMAAQAAEFYAYGHNSWQIGPEIFKAEDEALRYMDEPTKDCKGRNPGSRCSISNAKDFHEYLDVHYSSGVYNKLFYLMGTAKGWDTKMAFDVMVKANQDYWTANSTFVEGACGILKATNDYAQKDNRFDATSVQNAIAGVGIDASQCN